MDTRLGGPQSQFGCGGKDKISQPLPGLEPQFSSVGLFTSLHRTATQLTEIAKI
jgi:hypothetical protein